RRRALDERAHLRDDELAQRAVALVQLELHGGAEQCLVFDPLVHQLLHFCLAGAALLAALEQRAQLAMLLRVDDDLSRLRVPGCEATMRDEDERSQHDEVEEWLAEDAAPEALRVRRLHCTRPISALGGDAARAPQRFRASQTFTSGPSLRHAASIGVVCK